MSIAYLSLGSNMGDRVGNLSRAVALLDRPEEGIFVELVSPVFETKPVGYTEQDDFLNICLKVITDLSPMELLSACQKVEQELHRERKIHWGPRTIDVDILTYDDIKMDTERLTIPHPRMEERGFVQVPLLFLGGTGKIPEKWEDEVCYYGILPKYRVE